MSTSDKPQVQCDWANRDIVHVDPDGQVHPCCFFANVYYKCKYTEQDLYKHIPAYREYHEREQDFNVDNRSIDDIRKDEWFNETLEKSWESWDTIPHQCKIHCSQWTDPTNKMTPLSNFGKQHGDGEAIGWKKKEAKSEEQANITQHWNDNDKL